MKDKERIRATFVPKLEDFYQRQSRQPSQVSGARTSRQLTLENEGLILNRPEVGPSLVVLTFTGPVMAQSSPPLDSFTER